MSLSDELRNQYDGGPPTINCSKTIDEIASLIAPVLSSKKLLFRRHGIEDTLWTINHETGELHKMKDAAFRPWLAQYIQFVDGDGAKRDISMDTARSVLLAPQLQSRLPHLRAVNPIRMPYFKDREKGIIDLLPNGWHEDSQTFTIYQDFSFDTTWDVKDAVKYLDDILKTFPFAREGAPPDARPRSVLTQVCAMLTVFGANLFPWGTTFPLFAHIANIPGGGKSTLVRVAIVPVYGKAADTRYAETEWFDKELDSRARNGAPYLFLDNVSGFLKSDTLEAWLTQDSRVFRKMASHDEHSTLLRCVSFITGNNLRMKPDVDRRAEFVCLQSSGTARERQERRKQGIEIDTKWLLTPENRNSILSSLWAIMQDWSQHYDDRPHFDKPSYSVWASVIPSMVARSFGGDPLAPAKKNQSGDVYEDELQALMHHLIDSIATSGVRIENSEGTLIPGQTFRVSEIIAVCRQIGIYESLLGDIDTAAKEMEARKMLQPLRHPDGDGDTIPVHELTRDQRYQQAWDYMDRSMGIKMGQLLQKACDRLFEYNEQPSTWTLVKGRRSKHGKIYEVRFVNWLEEPDPNP